MFLLLLLFSLAICFFVFLVNTMTTAALHRMYATPFNFALYIKCTHTHIERYAINILPS